MRTSSEDILAKQRSSRFLIDLLARQQYSLVLANELHANVWHGVVRNEGIVLSHEVKLALELILVVASLQADLDLFVLVFVFWSSTHDQELVVDLVADLESVRCECSSVVEYS